MLKSIVCLVFLGYVSLWLSGCDDGVSASELAEVRSIAEEARTTAAEARDIALRAEQKADQALAAANDARSIAQQALDQARACCPRTSIGTSGR